MVSAGVFARIACMRGASIYETSREIWRFVAKITMPEMDLSTIHM